MSEATQGMADNTCIILIDVTPHEIVLRKPAGLLSEAPRGSVSESVLSRLRAEGLGDELRLVHRLDAPASGVMVVARTAEVAAYYNAEIAARRWHKIYVATVACPIERAQSLIGTQRAYLKTEGKRAKVVRSGGKPSFLTVAHVSPGERHSETHVVVRLHTGRFHQIRVMLAELGAPLAGDTVYGGPATGPIYLEHVLLAAQPFGASEKRVWQSPPAGDRPHWSRELVDAVASEHARISVA